MTDITRAEVEAAMTDERPMWALSTRELINKLEEAGKNEVWLTEMQAATEQRATRLEILCGELIAELGDDPARRLVPIVGRALDIQVRLEAAEAQASRDENSLLQVNELVEQLTQKLEAAEAENARLAALLERHGIPQTPYAPETTAKAAHLNPTEPTPTRHTLAPHAVAGQHVWMCEGCEIDREGP